MIDNRNIWVLLLNDMRSPQIECLSWAAAALSKEDLDALVESERVDRYSDDGWNKSFRKGGPLEWFNYPYTSAYKDYKNVGTPCHGSQLAAVIGNLMMPAEYDYCFCCETRVRVDKKHWRVHLLTTGGTTSQDDESPDSQGTFPVGPSCRKKYKHAWRNNAIED